LVSGCKLSQGGKEGIVVEDLTWLDGVQGDGEAIRLEQVPADGQFRDLITKPMIIFSSSTSTREKQT
jgi:hypothetical protein